MEQNEEVKKTESAAKKSYGWVIGLVVGLVILILLIVLGVGCFNKSINSLKNMGESTKNTSNWTEYNSPDGVFKATFPINPTLKTTTESVPNSDVTFKNDLYIAEITNAMAYMVNISFYPKDLNFNVDNVLKGALDGMLKTEGNQLVSSTPTDFNGNKATDYAIKNDKSGVSMKGKIIFVSPNLFQVAIAYRESNYNDSDYYKFINSFTLK